MRSKNLKGFNFSDSLNISYLELDDPQITFRQKENPEEIDIEDINNFDLYDLVKNDFSYINVDSFYLNNAVLYIFKHPDDTAYQQKFNNVNIHLINFELFDDADKNPEKLLYADNIEMNVRGYELNLEDNFHNFTADSIYASSFADSISVSGIRISPVKTADKTPVILDISCEQLLLDNAGIKEVYNKRILPCSVVEIKNPKVEIKNYPDVQISDNKGKLFELVSAYLKGVYANVILIENGSLNISNYANKKTADYFEAGISFRLTGFALDSTSTRRTDKFFYASDFDLNFEDFKMHLADNLHKLDVGNVHIANAESKVTIDSLHLYPAFQNPDTSILNRFNRSEVYDINIPKIILSGTDIHKAFFQKYLKIKNFTIFDPVISYENFASLKEKNERIEFSELYELIFNYVSDISITNLSAPSGEVKWINHSRKRKTTTLNNHFSTQLTNFRLNREEIGKQRLLFSDEIKFSLIDQLFKLSDNVHYLKAGKIDFSTREKQVVISNALLYPDITSPEFSNLPTTIQVAIPQLKFDNIDLVSAYYSKKPEVGEIVFDQPKLEIYSQTGKTKTLDLKKFSIPLPNIIESLKIRELKLKKGQVITYRTEGINHSQSSSFILDLSSDNVFVTHATDNGPNVVESNNISTRISDFQLISEDKSHQTRVDELAFNKNTKDIYIKNFRLTPSRFGQPENKFNIVVPTVQLKGFDIEEAYENNDYKFDEITFDSPVIDIFLSDTVENPTRQKFNDIDLYQYLEPYFNTLSINRFSLQKAIFKFLSPKAEINHEDINILVRNIAIGKNIKKSGILSSDGFEFQTFGYSKKLAKNSYNFRIDTIKYSSLTNIGELRGISIFPLLTKDEIARRKGTQVDVVNARISSARLYNFNFNNWLDNHIIEGSKLIIGHSQLEIFRNKRYLFNQDQRPLWPQQMINKINRPFSVDSVYIQPTDITYSELLETNDSPVTIKFSDVTARTGKITNIENSGMPKTIQVDAYGNIFEQGEINLSVEFDMQSPDFSHSVEGSLSPADMRIFNDVVEKNALLTVDEGQVNSLKFDFNANADKATGNLYFDYDNLKITVLNFKNGDTTKARLNTFMANSFMLHSKNPRGKNFDPEAINYTRDPSRSILNYWWKSIFKSAKTVLGIKEEKEKN